MAETRNSEGSATLRTVASLFTIGVCKWFLILKVQQEDKYAFFSSKTKKIVFFMLFVHSSKRFPWLYLNI